VKIVWSADTGEHWRNWKQKQDWLDALESIQWATYEKEMESQKISISEGPYIVRWGYKIKWMFTIQEGYHRQAAHH